MFILYRCNRKSNWNPVRPLSWGFSRSERAPAVQRRVQAGRTLSCQDQWRRPQHNETNSEKPSDSTSSPNAASFTSFIQIRVTNRNTLGLDSIPRKHVIKLLFKYFSSLNTDPISQGNQPCASFLPSFPLSPHWLPPWHSVVGGRRHPHVQPHCAYSISKGWPEAVRT